MVPADCLRGCCESLFRRLGRANASPNITSSCGLVSFCWGSLRSTQSTRMVLRILRDQFNALETEIQKLLFWRIIKNFYGSPLLKITALSQILQRWSDESPPYYQNLPWWLPSSGLPQTPEAFHQSQSRWSGFQQFSLLRQQ